MQTCAPRTRSGRRNQSNIFRFSQTFVTRAGAVLHLFFIIPQLFMENWSGKNPDGKGGYPPSLSTRHPPARHFQTRSTGPLPTPATQGGVTTPRFSTGRGTCADERSDGEGFSGKSGERKEEGAPPLPCQGGSYPHPHGWGGPWHRFRPKRMGGVGTPPHCPNLIKMGVSLRNPVVGE